MLQRLKPVIPVPPKRSNNQQPATHDTSHDTKEDIEKKAFALPVHDLAGDEARD